MSDLPAQPSLRRLKAFGIRPNRELGQNFLIDSNLLEVITRAAEVTEQDVVLEVGGGLGVLSEHLAGRAAHVHVVEVDRRLEPPLRDALASHPNDSTGYDDAVTDELRELANHPKVKAIGETGLDDYRDYAPRADQERAFDAQIELAHEVGKPLVIHTRAAEDDTVATLAEHAQGLEVILHCFSMPGRLDECLEHGWWISFAGNVTYPQATDLAEAAELTPLDRLLVETDAPYLTPQAVRKERNRPEYVVHTARFVAERRGISYAELEAAVEANAARLLGW